ncbi:MAG: hypothetical protein AB1461_00015 [Thermodesulfobacteriota bacterium]|jgi:class 3 adenylate cyclase
MSNKPDENNESLRQIAERLSRLNEPSDSLRKIAQKLQTDNERWQSLASHVAKMPPVIPSIAELVAARTGTIEKEKELLDRISVLSKELTETKKKKAEKEGLAAELQQALAEYRKQEEIKYLLGKLAKDAEDCIRGNPEFLAEFTPGRSHSAYVMSIDIRSSTELMLNAKTPDDFAEFITQLCDRLTELVIKNGGVFDKFTGDGVLAFFPDFYSGEDAGLRALLTASQAISFFAEHYKKHRRCFRVVTAGTGLGVGIDCGTVHFVNIGESLSVVGTPVVYACRLSAAPAGAIYLNQPAQEDIDSRYKAQTVIRETTLNIKGSGEIVVYDVQMKGMSSPPVELPWRQPTNESIATSG